jgi:coenzyme F420-reducing hydrogenase alpha subunit
MGYTYEGEGYMVGSLARINLAKDKLHPKTKESAAESLKLFPSTDIYYNNLAQAIEILHSVDESIDILSNNKFVHEDIIKGEEKEGAVGIGVVEAPRGTLYHKIILGADGKIKEGEVVVPTGQNQINIERDIGVLVQSLIEKSNFAEASLDKADIGLKIEKLIRAYDPCMSCASHFLKVKWK